MSDKYILDEHGHPVPCADLYEWAAWYESADRKVAKTQVGTKEVSTVFLGLDHNYCGGGPPLIYETMIFPDDEDGTCLRYSTLAEAKIGHASVVAALEARA